MPAQELILRMRVENGRVAQAELQGVSGQLDHVARHAGEAHRHVTLLGRGFGALRTIIRTVTGVVGLGGIGLGLGELIKNAETFQSRTAQLKAAIHANVVKPAKDATKQMIEFAESFTTRGGFGPGDEIQGLTQLLRTVHDTTRAQKDLVLATNIARGAHKNLGIAVRAVGMVEAGRLSMLTRLGIVLPKGTTQAQAYAILMKRYAGATDAYNKTASGAMTNFMHALDLVGEKIGLKVVPYLTIAFTWLGHFVDQIIKGHGAGKYFQQGLKLLGEVIKGVIGFVKDAVKWIEHFIKAFKENKTWAVALMAALGALASVALAEWIAGIVMGIKAWIGAQTILNFLLDANPIGIVIFAVAALVGALTVLYFKFKGVREVVDAVWSWLKQATQDVVGFIIGHWKLFATIAAGIILGPFGAIATAIITNFSAIKSFVTDIINWVIDRWNGLPFIHGFHIGPIHVPGLPKFSHIAQPGPSHKAVATNYSLPGHQGVKGTRAFGGDIPPYGGVYTVGEHGRENVYLPGGSRVEPVTRGGDTVLDNRISLGVVEVGRQIVRLGNQEKARQ